MSNYITEMAMVYLNKFDNIRKKRIQNFARCRISEEMIRICSLFII